MFTGIRQAVVTYKKKMQPMFLGWGLRIIGMAPKKRQLSLVSPWQQEPRDTDALGPMEMLGPSEMPTALAKRPRLDDTLAMEELSASRSAPAEPPLQFHQSVQSQQYQQSLEGGSSADFSDERAALDLWLLSLDEKGRLLPYGDALAHHYGCSRERIRVVRRRGVTPGLSIMHCVAADFWERIGVTMVGHKLLFAWGIAAL